MQAEFSARELLEALRALSGGDSPDLNPRQLAILDKAVRINEEK